MIPHYQASRNTLFWLFISQLLVFIPHFSRMPWWVAVLLIACMGWRIQVFRGVWSFPKRSVKTGITLLAGVLILIGFPSLISLEIMVGTLFVAYALKLLEMYKKRDVLVMIYLSFFLIMTHFIFNQEIVLALYDVLVVTVLLSCLTSLYQEDEFQLKQEFKKTFSLVLQAVPLMIVMFLVLPRLPSFWNMPLQKNVPKTGVGDIMSPGDFTRLTRDSSTVFRVNFEGDIPEQKDLYWRGLVFSHFDGRNWEPSGTQINYKSFLWHEGNQAQFLRRYKNAGRIIDGEPLDYDIIMEPSGNHWLYGLNKALPKTSNIALSNTSTLVNKTPVKNRFQYHVRSYPETADATPLNDLQYRVETSLPADVNPRSKEIAKQWFKQSASAEEYINRLLSEFNQNFFYTLSPPKLGKHTVDEFMFDTKRGFCEHFASSFVFMLRTVGIPARVVVGYQGGEINEYENYLIVRQYDAHAWAEVWIENKGWVRYDPTFAVAPERVLDGFRGLFESSDELNLSVFSLESFRRFSFVNELLKQADSINYLWARWVLGYDATMQKQILDKWLQSYSMKQILLILTSIVALILIAVCLIIFWRERDTSTDPAVRLFNQFKKRLLKKGIELQPGTPPQKFIAEYEKTLDSDNAPQSDKLKSIVQHFYSILYEKSHYSEEELQHLKLLLKQWR